MKFWFSQKSLVTFRAQKLTFFAKTFFSKFVQIPRFSADLLAFTEKIINWKLHFFNSDFEWKSSQKLYISEHVQLNFLKSNYNLLTRVFRLKWSSSLIALSNVIVYWSSVVNYFQSLKFLLVMSLHKNRSFPSRTSAVSVTKSAGNCGFGHSYWRNP